MESGAQAKPFCWEGGGGSERSEMFVPPSTRSGQSGPGVRVQGRPHPTHIAMEHCDLFLPEGRRQCVVWVGASVSVGASLSVQGRSLNGDAGTPLSALGRVREKHLFLSFGP